MGGRRYTDADVELLRDIAKTAVSFAAVAEEYRKRGGRCVKRNAIAQVCRKSGIHLQAHNGHFKAGHRTKTRLPIGAEAEKDGCVYIKVTDNPVPAVESATEKGRLRWANYRKKSELVWEKRNGKRLPPGGIVVHLNMDSHDFRPENLYCINRRINAIMNKNRWYKQNAELTLTAIKLCELRIAIKEVQK